MLVNNSTILPLDLTSYIFVDYDSLNNFKKTCHHNYNIIDDAVFMSLFFQHKVLIPYYYVKDSISVDDWLSHTKITIQSFDNPPPYLKAILEAWQNSSIPIVIRTGQKTESSVLLKHIQNKRTFEGVKEKKNELNRFTNSESLKKPHLTMYIKNLEPNDLIPIEDRFAYMLGNICVYNSSDSNNNLTQINDQIETLNTVASLNLFGNSSQKISAIYKPDSNNSERRQISPRSVSKLIGGELCTGGLFKTIN